jgi:hypothetical protein
MSEEKKVRLSLWLYGKCVIRSAPLLPTDAEERMQNWRRTYDDAEIRTEAV